MFRSTILASALCALSLLAPAQVWSQCSSGPRLVAPTPTCTIATPCEISVSLDTGGESVASAAATIASGAGLECASTCSAGASAPNGSCSINADICRFNVADLSEPFTAFADGEVGRVTASCSVAGTHELSLSQVSLGDTDGFPIGACGAPGSIECVQPFLCFAAADPAASFTGTMTTGFAFTDGADDDPLRDNLTTPLLFADSSSNAFNGGSGDSVSYPIDLPAGGSWFLWARFYYPGAPGSNDANSFLAKVDGGPLLKLGNNKDFFQTWHWDGDGEAETGPVAPLALGSLAAGVHSLVIEKREVVPTPPRLDVVCLTQDPDAVPTDAQACAALGGCS